ncbi:uncharacterized protein [Rutidosis leptorrhynchoides]|uniref:uncharacterized protein n=1 Tax=Rutidosis leptorrhynchoides TaxID=125765 RepID=UPI003A99C1B9
MSKKIGDGCDTKFWTDQWIRDTILATGFPRLFALDCHPHLTIAFKFLNGEWRMSWRHVPRGGAEQQQLTELLNILNDFSLTVDLDYWIWDGPNACFSVSHARCLIDAHELAPFTRATYWCKYVPLKVNVFNCHLRINRLPTKDNLALCNINIQHLRCGLCNNDLESVNHLFTFCSITSLIWHRVQLWIGLSLPNWSSVEDIWAWVDGVPITGHQRIILRVIFLSAIWNIRRFRNSIVFKDPFIRANTVFDTIVVFGFNWLYTRFCKTRINWTSWLQNPLYSL